MRSPYRDKIIDYCLEDAKQVLVDDSVVDVEDELALINLCTGELFFGNELGE